MLEFTLAYLQCNVGTPDVAVAKASLCIFICLTWYLS